MRPKLILRSRWKTAPGHQNIHFAVHHKECAQGETVTSAFLPALPGTITHLGIRGENVSYHVLHKGISSISKSSILFTLSGYSDKSYVYVPSHNLALHIGEARGVFAEIAAHSCQHPVSSCCLFALNWNVTLVLYGHSGYAQVEHLTQIWRIRLSVLGTLN